MSGFPVDEGRSHGRHCLQEVTENLFFRACGVRHEVEGMIEYDLTGLQLKELELNFKIGFVPEFLYAVNDSHVPAIILEALQKTKNKKKRSRKGKFTPQGRENNKIRKKMQKMKKKLANMK